MRVRTAVGIAGGVVGVAVGAPTWWVARLLDRQGFQPGYDRDRFVRDLQVTAVSDQTVTLRTATKNPSVASHQDGEYLLDGARGYGFARRVLESNGVITVREYRPGSGDIRAGDYARLDPYAYPADPLEAHGMEFEEVEIASPLGRFPAWHVTGHSNTWAIVVHGKGASRREGLRILPALVEAGFHCLVISYRNDEGCPPAPDGRYAYGRGEWEELDAAAAYALAQEASDLVLCGYSMGGAVTLSFMERSSRASSVSGLVLDAPMWHLEACVRHAAGRNGIPRKALAVTNRFAASRYRFRWNDFDYLRVLGGLQAPVLLFHGDADETIPVSLSDTAASLRRDLITYIRLDGVGHVRAWNASPRAYHDAVLDFVRTKRRAGMS